MYQVPDSFIKRSYVKAIWSGFHRTSGKRSRNLQTLLPGAFAAITCGSKPSGAVVFKTSPIPFAIRTAAIDLSASPQLGWGVAIWLACKDADFFYESLQKAAVSILTPIHDGPFGRFFTFKDPDGYSITLHTKPTHATR